MKIAFIGLGVMGFSMAGHQQHAGNQVCVYNRTYAKALKWVDSYGGTSRLTPVEAAKGADVVMVCVGNDDDVRNVLYGEQGALAGLETGAYVVDHTTTSHALAQELDGECKKQGLHFLDAPVSGGQAGAENGTLAIMIGGNQADLAAVTPAMEPYAQVITHMGDVGAGQMTKMVNQLLIAGVLQGISEGLILARKTGLDLPKVIEAIGQGAAGSWQLTNRALNIHADKFDYGFAIDLMQKDLGFCLDAAKKLGLELPNAEFVSQRYSELQNKGYNRCDTSVLIKQYEESTTGEAKQ